MVEAGSAVVLLEHGADDFLEFCFLVPKLANEVRDDSFFPDGFAFAKIAIRIQIGRREGSRIVIDDFAAGRFVVVRSSSVCVC